MVRKIGLTLLGVVLLTLIGRFIISDYMMPAVGMCIFVFSLGFPVFGILYVLKR